MLLSEVRHFYHTFTSIADPTEAESRRRRLLLALEPDDVNVIYEITRPLGSESVYPNKKRRTTEHNSSSSAQNIGGAAGPVPPLFP